MSPPCSPIGETTPSTTSSIRCGVEAGVAVLQLVDEAGHQVDGLDLVQRTDVLALAARVRMWSKTKASAMWLIVTPFTVTVQQVWARVHVLGFDPPTRRGLRRGGTQTRGWSGGGPTCRPTCSEEHDAHLLTLDVLTEPHGRQRAQRAVLRLARPGALARTNAAARATTGPTTSPASGWSACCRATASRCRRSRSTSSRIPATATSVRHRPATSPCSHPSPATVTWTCRGGLVRDGHPPPDAAQAVAEVYAEHGRQVAEEASPRSCAPRCGRSSREAGYTAEQAARVHPPPQRSPSPAW